MSEKIHTMKYRIDHAYNAGTVLMFDHPEQLKGFPHVSGVYTTVGGGYCTKCAEFIDPSDLDSYETKDCPMIICENCGTDTAL